MIAKNLMLVLLSFLLIFSCTSNRLSKELNNSIYKFLDSEMYVELKLTEDRFEFMRSALGVNCYSVGTWKIKRQSLVLESRLDTSNDDNFLKSLIFCFDETKLLNYSNDALKYHQVFLVRIE